jgi:hypothetical protein
MNVPSWILDIFAAVMLLVAAVSAVRLVAAWPRRGRPAAGLDPDIDGAHLLMGVAMAGMLSASLATLPGHAWEAVFGVLTAWFAWRVSQDARGHGIRGMTGSQHLPHLVHSAAMLYMFAAVTAPAGAVSQPGMAMGGAGGGMLRLPTLAFAFALILSGFAVRDLDQLTGPAGHAARLPALAGASSGAGAAPAYPALAAAAGHQAAAVSAAAAPGRPLGGAGAEMGSSAPAAATVAGTRPAGTPGLLLGPRAATGCRIAMGITMALMLIILI